jgi:hypothetical protein
MDILALCLIIGFFALSWRFVLACAALGSEEAKK